MRLPIIIILLITSFNGVAQISFEKKIGGEFKAVVFVYAGVLFQPVNEASNKHESVLCANFTEAFLLNGLTFNKSQFIDLELTSKYLENDSTTFFNKATSKQGYGTYEYKYGDDKSCANQIIYRTKVKLPVILNGVELDLDKQEGILRKISPFEIVSVERKSSFFGGGEIYIETKSRQ